MEADDKAATIRWRIYSQHVAKRLRDDASEWNQKDEWEDFACQGPDINIVILKVCMWNHTDVWKVWDEFKFIKQRSFNKFIIEKME